MSRNQNRSEDSENESAGTMGEGGGFYHNGRFVTMRNVVENYHSFLSPSLTAKQQIALVEYLKSL